MSSFPHEPAGVSPEDPKEDPVAGYLSVFSALKNIDDAPILGVVVNGTVSGYEDEDEDEDEYREDEDDEGDETDLIATWASKLGTQLAHAAHYTAFACGGDLRTVTFDHDGMTVKHTLRVLSRGEVVSSWPLDEPLPVAELLPFCTPARFGDLRSQETVLDPAVRTALEIPVGGGMVVHYCTVLV
jgi:hypothetical protein